MGSQKLSVRKLFLNGETHNFLNNFGDVLYPVERCTLEELTRDLFSKAFEYVDNVNNTTHPTKKSQHELQRVPFSTMYQYIWRLDTPLSHKKFIDNTIIHQERDAERVCQKLSQAFAQYDMAPLDFHDLVGSKFNVGTFFASCKNNSGSVSEASLSIWDQNLVSALRVTKTGERKKYYQLFAPYAVGPFGNKLFHELLIYIHNYCHKMGIHYLYINLDENSNMRQFFPLQKGIEVNKYLELVQPLTKEAEGQIKTIVKNKKKNIFSDPRDNGAVVIYADEYTRYLMQKGRL